MLHDTVQQLESIYLISRNDSPVCAIFTGQELSSSIHNRYRIDSLPMAISKQSILGGDNEVSPLLSQYSSVDGDIQTLGFRPRASSRHLRDLHILSFTFLFVFLAYSASQNLESTLNTDKDLGTMSLGILYLSFALFSLVATPVVRRLGSKNSLILGTSGFWLFIAANFRPSWYTMVPASVYVGFTASVIWVGAGTYLTCAAKDHATECGLPEGRVIGNFNGEFWGMCASTQVIGNLFSLILLKNGMVETVLTASVVQAGKSTLNTTLLFTVFLGSMTLGTILACFLSKQSGTKAELTVQHSFESDSSLQNQVKAIFVPLLDRRMLLLIPLFAYSGLQQSFVWAELTKYVISPALGVLGVGGAMAIYGASDTICSLVAGRLTTGLLSITFITCGGMLFQVLVILRLWLKHSGFTTGGVDLANLLGMTAIWGIGNGIFNTQISALLGILFAHNTDKDLGTMSLGIVYFSFAVFSVIATPVVRRLGSKNSLILGTSGFWLFIAANLWPSWCTMVPASIFVGFTAAIIWVGAGTYLTSAARGHATECNLPEATVIGNFNGEFWGMCASTQVIGNLISLILLKNEKGAKSTSGTTLLFTVFLGSMTLATILACFLSKQSGTKAELTVQHTFRPYSSVGNLVKAVFVPLLDRRMLLLIPLFIYAGLQQSFAWAEFTKYIVSPALGVSGVAGAMVIFGAADTICSLVAGRLTTGLLSITFITSGGMLVQVLVLLRLWLKHSFRTRGMDIMNLLGMAAMWGIGNGIFNTQISALLGILFSHNAEAAFSQFKIWQNAAISAALLVSPQVTFASMLALLAAVLLMSLVGFLSITLWLGKAVRV